MSPGAYSSAKNQGFLKELIKNKPKTNKELPNHKKQKPRILSDKDILKIAKKYKTRQDFCIKDHATYITAHRRGILNKVCKHMRKVKKGATIEEIFQIAKKYKKRGEFLKNDFPAYCKASKLKILDEVCKHMDPKDNEKLIDEKELYRIAKKYKYKSDFYANEHATYENARRRGILSKICNHMEEKPKTVKKAEKEILKFIQSYFSDAKNQWFYNLKIKGRPYIKAFELDILVPSLNKAIEFDGAKWHSKEHLMKRVKKGGWTKNARLHYHEIKDKVFLDYFNIKILHISDTEWLSDQFGTKNKIIDFLTS